MSVLSGSERTPNEAVLEKDREDILKSHLRTADGNRLDLTSTSPPDSFNPGWRFYAAFTSLCIITIAVALDATSLSVALPVMDPHSFPSIAWVKKE